MTYQEKLNSMLTQCKHSIVEQGSRIMSTLGRACQFGKFKPVLYLQGYDCLIWLELNECRLLATFNLAVFKSLNTKSVCSQVPPASLFEVAHQFCTQDCLITHILLKKLQIPDFNFACIRQFKWLWTIELNKLC